MEASSCFHPWLWAVLERRAGLCAHCCKAELPRGLIWMGPSLPGDHQGSTGQSLYVSQEICLMDRNHSAPRTLLP